MKTEYELNVDVKPRGITSAYVVAPFDKGKERLKRAGYHIISLEENARLRVQEGKDSYCSENGNWVREDVIYVPNKGRFLTKNSQIMLNAKEATNCHRSGLDFYLTNEQVEKCLADSVELSGELIPTNRFKDDKVTVYAFGDYAETYGDFLNEVGINEMPVRLADIQDKPFARKLWFCGLDSRSMLDGNYRGLHLDRGVRGAK
ncbi:MAG: hypothetical protein WC781_03550 [Candidatus Pacearchaeota archaeon]|jgi:hypothetical protein